MNFFARQRRFKDDAEEIEYVVNIIMNLPEKERCKTATISRSLEPQRSRDLSCTLPLEYSLMDSIKNEENNNEIQNKNEQNKPEEIESNNNEKENSSYEEIPHHKNDDNLSISKEIPNKNEWSVYSKDKAEENYNNPEKNLNLVNEEEKSLVISNDNEINNEKEKELFENLNRRGHTEKKEITYDLQNQPSNLISNNEKINPHELEEKNSQLKKEFELFDSSDCIIAKDEKETKESSFQVKDFFLEMKNNENHIDNEKQEKTKKNRTKQIFFDRSAAIKNDEESFQKISSHDNEDHILYMYEFSTDADEENECSKENRTLDIEKSTPVYSFINRIIPYIYFFYEFMTNI